MIFCLSACGEKEIISNPTNVSSETQTETQQSSNEDTSTEVDSNQATSNIEVPIENNASQEQSPSQSETSNATSQPTHTHSFSSATCTSPKKCACGATEGSALGHQFSSATCTTPKTCSRCGITEGNSLGHNYKDGICSVCNAVDEQKYIDAQIDAADKAFKDYTKYNDALKIIKAALQKYPQNENLKLKRDYYQNFEPVNLCDLNPYKNSYAYISNGSSSDNFGNWYEECVYKPYYNANASATYDIGYKYNLFKATVFMRCDCTGETYGTVKIYGDKSLLYEKTEIDVYGRPFDIEVDVTGIQDLEVVIESESGAFIFGLANCVLQRTVK